MTDPTDDEIEQGLRASTGNWDELWKIWHQVQSERDYGTWAGGQKVDTRVVDGVEQAVIQMPYVEHPRKVMHLIGLIYELGLVVPFDWSAWVKGKEYPRDASLEGAPVADAVRLLTAILRADRFNEGTIRSTLEDGTFSGAMTRLLHWYTHERDSS
ncbi:MAG TPA: DUF6508 domain-containing protein [Actinomycetota bacterium]|nr:DUF6508 domain-containing protein [Actinomycetota bacterium]